ncbi:MAG TPA: hypothetical protein VK427_02040, partial [Kofleriaceae bacterium]|nr:hypothetical protein [Kofleriaceae bacterium]
SITCASCHRAHGGGAPGVERPPACTTCHTANQRPSLHRVNPGHASCASCHVAHERAARDDRATCMTCHDKLKNHEPQATRCAGCHPFGDGKPGLGPDAR